MDKIRKIHEFISPSMCVEEAAYISLPHNEWVQCNALLLLNTGFSHNFLETDLMLEMDRFMIGETERFDE